MKASNLFAFLGGAAVAAGITLLFTTEKGAKIRSQVSEKLSKEELDKLIAKLKRQREEVAQEEAAESL